MTGTTIDRFIEILLVEDSPSDTELTIEALASGYVCNHLNIVDEGEKALQFLYRQGEYADAPRPDLILLDLNLPRLDGREVLAIIKADPDLKTIPVVVLTTSEAEADVLSAYTLHANCYIIKPIDFKKFVDAVKAIEHFWFSVVTLPD
jgi:CheY-like chemotaxis protein